MSYQLTINNYKMTTNQIALAKNLAQKLNDIYGENIFSVKYGSSELSATIINDLYRREGTDVDITFDEDGIIGSVTGLTMYCESEDDLIENIDQLFTK